MKPFYLISILFTSLGTAIPVIPRDNNGILDNFLAIVKDAIGIDLTPVHGVLGTVLNGGTKSILINSTVLGLAEAIFDEVKSKLGIQDPRSLEETIASLEEAGNETFNQFCQLLDTFRREDKGPAGGTIDSLGVGNISSLDLASSIDLIINLVNTSSFHLISLKPLS
ncbi:hypothetical protein THAR02_06013 [Trichoderma harzianum]|uniref:Uncharacterized protein n=1 Tax=Trichoderma harzianum TaxID=5544 RepID=A0A0G0AA41_TRIHA|nr:hypothetical protein THAR02_06013 [Trichoderma harzianum]